MWLTSCWLAEGKAGDVLTVKTLGTERTHACNLTEIGQLWLIWLTCTRPAFPYFEQQDDDRSQMREISCQPEDIHGRRETDAASGLTQNSLFLPRIVPHRTPAGSCAYPPEAAAKPGCGVHTG